VEFDAWNRERKKWTACESDSDTYRPSSNFGFWADGSGDGGNGGRAD
jgi:hypothetical protein